MELFSETLKWELEVYMTEKAIVFTRPKNATRVTDIYLLEAAGGIKTDITFSYDSNGIKYLTHEVMWQIKEEGQLEETRSTTIKKEFQKELDLALSGKSKKDLLFFYRNPWDRLVSGLYQEFVSTLQDSKFFYYNTKDYGKTDIEMLREVKKNLQNINGNERSAEMITMTDDIIHQNKSIFVDLIKEWFEYLKLEYHFNLTHCNTYMFMYNEILSLPKIDLNKCFLYDVSKIQIETILEKYSEATSKIKGFKHLTMEGGKVNKKVFSSKTLKRFIYEILNNNISDYHRLNDLYREEIVSFYKLQNHKSNTIK